MSTERMTSQRLRMLAAGGMTQAVFFEAVRARVSEDEKDAEIARLRAALKPFAEFARKWNARPILGLDDGLYNIHGGDGVTEDGATLRLSDCRNALKSLEGA